ncbi:MAG: histidinol-phosphatase, partial [Bacteroidales bacterium]|nr:histidinol-phosphatase [Bacteroidales bacterium]
EKGLDILGITDHNHTGQCATITEMAGDYGITVLCGAEVTTKEEAHCVALFGSERDLKDFQKLLDDSLNSIKNKPDLFGHQVIVDRDEMIVEEVDNLLIAATSLSVSELEKEVHQRNGLFIPAHINRDSNSLISQLGFIPPDLNADALEISKHTDKETFLEQHPELSGFTFIQCSDAHFPEDIGAVSTLFEIQEPAFEEIRKALKGEDNRRILLK